jgi:translation initiation factor 4A
MSDILTASTNTNTNTNQDISSWEELDNIKTPLLRGIYSYGFETPSPIQKKAIVPMFNKKDIIAQAQSGTGKTGCFSIGVLQLIDITKNITQAMILSPTRELSIQTKEVVDALGSQFTGLRTHLLIGGTSTDEDARTLQEKPPHIVIGCSGRIYDMLNRKKLNSKNIVILVIDEADEMLSDGFKDQVYNIFQFLPNAVQVALFSATMPPELNVLTKKFMRNPVEIFVKAEQLTLEGINQFYVALDNDNQKYDTLKDIYGTISISQCIIYCNSISRVTELYNAMSADGFPVCYIHSTMNKNERTQNYMDFKNGKFRVLISSNVTSRGIDIQQVSTVINFDIPKCVHTYLHRIGRSGRWGRKGVGINFVTQRDMRTLKEIEAYYGTRINELTEIWSI